MAWQHKMCGSIQGIGGYRRGSFASGGAMLPTKRIMMSFEKEGPRVVRLLVKGGKEMIIDVGQYWTGHKEAHDDDD